MLNHGQRLVSVVMQRVTQTMASYLTDIHQQLLLIVPLFHNAHPDKVNNLIRGWNETRFIAKYWPLTDHMPFMSM